MRALELRLSLFFTTYSPSETMGADEAVGRIKRRHGGLGSPHQFDKHFSLHLVSFFKHLQSFLPLYYLFYHNFSIHGVSSLVLFQTAKSTRAIAALSQDFPLASSDPSFRKDCRHTHTVDGSIVPAAIQAIHPSRDDKLLPKESWSMKY
ncbi:hypothetical protein Y032_0044g1076 [Ancylostoma ceylanicum]|uniref:Uncharacterized protein n=1 Tax=Ancylostoma ceylanicum TaxID=53326 RepID=A0A016UEI0_9BILA|nr:hypothetical protein Y032_0044g1076 [Ancylostoma ceylanicum]